MANRSDAFTYSADPIENGTPTDGGSDWVGGGSYGANGSIMYRNGGDVKRLDCGATDHEASVKLDTAGTSSGVIARASSDTAFYLWERNNSGNMTLYKAPTFDVLGAAGTAGNGDTIAVRCVGTTIKGYVNGVEQVSATDATHTTGTYGGVYSGNQFDDFAITDLSGGPSLAGARRRRVLLCGGR